MLSNLTLIFQVHDKIKIWTIFSDNGIALDLKESAWWDSSLSLLEIFKEWTIYKISIYALVIFKYITVNLNVSRWSNFIVTY